MKFFSTIWFKLLLALILIAGAFFIADWWSGKRYDKKQAAYEAEKQQWATEKAALEAGIIERDKKMAQREVQIQALEAAGEAKKKVDDELAKKIEDEAKKIVDAERNAQIPTDCRTRAGRICDLFRATDKQFNCAILFSECAGQ